MQTITVKTNRRTQFLDVTAQVQKAVPATRTTRGTCYLYVPHTTAAVTINECADPDVARDIEGALDRLVPATGPYRHSEGNSDEPARSCSWWTGSWPWGAGKAFSFASLMVRASENCW
jgi:secondary thiamine-phosphate synthase enzyme